MAEYHLLTIWRIEAPLDQVYAAIENSLQWPEWWLSVRKVEPMASGGSDGVGNVRRYAWQGKLPYRVVFDVRATRIERLVTIQGTAEGDLSGVGCWKFSQQGSLSVVQYEWHVHSNRWWMNLIAPVARSIFIRNHAQIMEQGGRALARLLKAPLPVQGNIDLMAIAVKPRPARRRQRQRGRINSPLAVFVGLGAVVMAITEHLDLWWLAGFS
jgi:hypothetical protein